MTTNGTSKALLLLCVLVLSAFALSSTLTPDANAQNPTLTTTRSDADSAEPGVGTYTLTTGVTPAGSGTVTTDPVGPDHLDGTEVTISANPAAGWRFVEWTGDLSSTNSPETLIMDADKSVTAVFAKRCHALTLSKVGSGADIVASPTKSAGCTNAGEYHFEEVVTLTAAPDSGWAVTGWSGTDNNGSTAVTNQVTMPDASHKVTVTYTQLCYSLTTSVNPSGKGTVERLPAPNCDTNKYLSGTEVQLTAVPNAGYYFKNWSGDATGIINPTTVKMNGNRSVTANLGQACYPLTLTHTGNGADPTAVPAKSPICGSAGEYVLGQLITVTAAPAADSQVEDWEGTTLNSSTSTVNTLLMPASAHVVTVNYILKPTLQFSAASYSVNEDAGTATIQVTRTGSTREAVTVNYATSDDTAVAGADYESASGTLAFAANETSQSFTVPINDDTTSEGTESFNLTLSSPSGNARLGSQTTAVVDILDDEGTPTLQFASSTFTVDESQPTVAITITLFPKATKRVYVDFATSDDTAVAGSDYSATSKTVSIAAGGTETVVMVPIANDALDENDETFTVTLFNEDRAALGLDEATVTILDDDPQPTVQFTAEEYFAVEGDASATIMATLTGASSFEVTADYDGNKPGTDGTLTFTPGTTSQTFTVPTASYAAGTEILFTLRTPANASLGDPSLAKLTILDANRGDCHPLTLSHTGFGSDPVASPLNSLACPAGTYVMGESISVTAVPDPGWSISGWTGTQNPNDTSANNVVQMPDDAHAVTVSYVRNIYLASIMYSPYFEGPNELEPNNSYSDAKANGPIRPGTTYAGTVAGSDEWDFYAVSVDENDQSVTVTLSDIPANHNYDLYLIESDPTKYQASIKDGTAIETITRELDKGIYYVGVLWISGAPTADRYSLQVNFD